MEGGWLDEGDGDDGDWRGREETNLRIRVDRYVDA